MRDVNPKITEASPTRSALALGRGGLRVIAAYEAAKGLLVLLVGAAAFNLAHQNVQRAAEELVRHLHLNPAKRIPHIFMEAAAQTSLTRLHWIAAGAALYAALRLVEAYGLWHARRWAEWLAVLGAAVYVPFEVWELAKGLTWLKVALVLINFGIVLYLARQLRRPP
jgi:uncharacterized membrane protein (DUF2068 family)